MKRLHHLWPAALVLVLLFVSALPGSPIMGYASAAVTVPTAPVPESKDFAGTVLRDSWDMTEYSDISRNMNGVSTVYSVSNPKVENGVFSASSTSLNDAYFTLLYPGTAPATLYTLRDGGLNPIPNSYHCLYFAMKVDTSANDYYSILWFADSSQNAGQWGRFDGRLHPESGGHLSNWKLYKLDLGALPIVPYATTPWNGLSQWQGLRIDPVNRANTTFAVDWARLTTCQATTRTITWTPDASVNAIWIQPVGTTRSIRVAPSPDPNGVTGINGNAGSYDLDTQGLAPGSYKVGMGTLNTPPTSWSSQPLVINAAPIGSFVVPSMSSGDDYATTAGNPWDFNDSSDVTKVQSQAKPGAVSWRYTSDGIEVTSPSGPLPAGIDTQVYLNTPTPIDARAYRYLSFRMYNTWTTKNFGVTPWAANSMLVRLVWSVPSLTGKKGYECTYVSDDMPLDIGWRTYTFDMFDARNGKPDGDPVPGAPHCPPNGSSIPWNSHPQITRLRFDPNENVSEVSGEQENTLTGGGPFIQTIDWIRLTKDNTVARGAPYAVRLSLNKPADQVTGTYYYTTNRSQPTQHKADAVNLTPPAPAANKIYLPTLNKAGGYNPDVPNPAMFQWDTSSVAPGTYYICGVLNDGVNSSTTCSDVAVTVTP